MGDERIHGCWVTGADRVCEDGTKGCSREHPLREAPTADREHCVHIDGYCVAAELRRYRATVARLRALAAHLVERECAPSFDGYALAAGLDAAADLLEGRPGPIVWDSDRAKDAPLSTLRAAGDDRSES